MTNAEIEKEIIWLVAEQSGCLPTEDIAPRISLEDQLIGDDLLALDSLDVVEIVMALEEKYDLAISDADVEAWETVGDVVRYVQNPA